MYVHARIMLATLNQKCNLYAMQTVVFTEEVSKLNGMNKRLFLLTNCFSTFSFICKPPMTLMDII